MASNTAFGPQSPNAAVSLPAGSNVNRYGTGVDTWCQNCSSLTAGDGTVVDADWFNNIIGNLRNLVAGAKSDGAAIALDDGDMNLVWNAVKFYAGGGFGGVGATFASAGIYTWI